MGTRARIGIQLNGNSILSAYHHWDGYPEWLGKVLVEHYNTKEKVAALIDGGDMSVCWTDEGWNSDGITVRNKEEFGPQYYSERGEDCPPRFDEDMFDFVYEKENNEEYAYVWTVNNKWVCMQMNQFNDSKPQKVEIPA
tara:strand:+ start:486 stop:902 length:417 start_codon:yes stop_codon:yes gene_type:complete